MGTIHDIPAALSHRPRAGGVPVPFVASVPAPGQPVDFTAADPARLRQALLQRLCGICGRLLDEWMVFHVLPATLLERVVAAAGAHEGCARYALLGLRWPSIGLAFVRGYGVEHGPVAARAILFEPHHIEWWSTRRGRLERAEETAAL